jgi:hypothetical protein
LRHRVAFACTVVSLAAVLVCLVFLGVGAATAPVAQSDYTLGASPTVDGVGGGATSAPWNTSQGDTTAGTPYYEQPGVGVGATSLLFPTYTPSANPTYETTIGGVTEPNLAVYPTSSIPYPSGVAGSPGPLDQYCTSGGASHESQGRSSQPAGTILPFAPYYFPDVVRNSGGTLTGYFDYRPKDADEAITVAHSSDGGITWQTDGLALEQNPSYCPTADTNDDGQGHPFVMATASMTNLYTLQRAAGDNAGVGLLVHPIDPSNANPLHALPASQSVGVDPNTFATSSISVPAASSGMTAMIPVNTLGTPNTVNSIVPGPYQDPSLGNLTINCAGTATGPNELTGCTNSSGGPVGVTSGDDLVQVIATANPSSTKGSCSTDSGATYTIPNSSAQNTGGTGGLQVLCFNISATTGLANASSESPVTAYLLNDNAPNRVYIDGNPVYCTQGNANPTTKLEDCTSPDGPFTVNPGDAITADPIVPDDNTATGGHTQMTTGLIAPDGIVGSLGTSLTSYNGQSVPSGDTVVLYTEKILNYYVVGTTNGYINSSNAYKSGTITLGSTQGINFTPSLTTTEWSPTSLGGQGTPTGSFTIYLGTSSSSPLQSVTCTGYSAAAQSGVPAGSYNLTGCSGGTGAVASGNWIGGPGAAITPVSALGKIAEGDGTKSSATQAEKLFGNNEDYSALRAAYTSDGVNFIDLGAISGNDGGSGSTNGSYDDISNPNQQESPQSSQFPNTATLTPTTPTNLAPGALDAIELRYIGSRGTIITNPNGTYGMFLSGAWASDGDSDAFNQIFYSESSDGLHWSVPQVVLSSDYTFSASAAQETGGGPLGISAYYSGRAYGPAIVQNANGTLTMVFSGYRVPKGIPTVGDVYGTGVTNTGTATPTYTVGSTDPALYRNILTVTLGSSTTPLVGTSSALTTSAAPGTYGTQLTYTDTLSVPAPGTGIPTGTVDFYDGGLSNPIAGCQNVALSDTATDTAACQTTPTAVNGHSITAVYSGDSNYQTSTGSYLEHVNPAPLTANVTGSQLYGGTPTFTVAYNGLVNGDSAGVVSGPLTGCTTSVGRSAGLGAYSNTISNCSGLSATNYAISYAYGTFTVNPPTVNVTGSVPSTLGVSVVGSSSASFGSFAPGTAQTYTATIDLSVTSSAGSATLTAIDSTGTFTGYLVNNATGGPYVLASPFEVEAADGGSNTSTGYQPLTSGNVRTLLSYGAPVSSDPVTVGFSQSIGATDPLRTGTYAKAITLTLSTTSP